jgi:hypothetical protein
MEDGRWKMEEGSGNKMEEGRGKMEAKEKKERM